MKILSGLIALISGLLTGDTSLKLQSPSPLNAAVISFHETYFAPAVAEPGNFPFAKSIKIATTAPPSPLAPILSPTQITVAPPPVITSDSYLVNPEPIVNWYVPVTIQGRSTDGNSTLPEMTFDREFWRIEVLAYWAPGDPSHPPVEKDYFTLEVYDKKTDKLIYTMTSNTDETMHKFQAFKKSGTYYFKTYPKNPSQFFITFTFH